MKGFIHIYEVEEDLEEKFKTFADLNTGGNYKFALRFLLSFHTEFKNVLDLLKNKSGVTIKKSENIEVRE